MKLHVKVDKAASVGGGKSLMVFDEHGEPLPNQLSVRFEAEVTEYPVVTIRLLVDGKNIELI